MSKKAKYDLDNGSFIGEHKYCIAEEFLESHKGCGSSDALCVYEHEQEDGSVVYDATCKSCNQYFSVKEVHSSSLAEDLGVEPDSGEVKERKNFNTSKKSESITKDQVKYIIDMGYDSGNLRGIKDKYSQFFGHVTKKDKNGKPVARYYPETDKGRLMGYKCRNLPKNFKYGKLGRTGATNDLSGYVKFKDYVGHRDILIVGGEEDKAAAFQMLRDNQIRKNQEDYAPIAVVSPTTGEGGSIKQLQRAYDWLCGFENIILAFDNDQPGHEAMAEAVKVLPKEKVKIASWTGKDPNKMLQDGQEKQFLADFYNAKPLVSNGILTSTEADGTIEEELLRPKMTLNPFMKALQKAFAGGIPLGYIVNIVAETGIGKTTLVNELTRHLIFESPYKVGILSLELAAAQYMIAMLSREVGQKINLIEDPQEAVDFVRTPEVLLARKHLTVKEDGEERFVLLDERDGDLELVKKQCETLIRKHSCKVIMIDPIQDLFEGVSMEEQTAFIKWMKKIIKEGVTIINVCHVRKGNNSTDRDGNRIIRQLTEDDVSGVSNLVKSGGANVFLTRNKYAEDPIIRNTTHVSLGKCRWSGITSNQVGLWYYALEEHTMYDLYDYFSDNPDKLPEGYDLQAIDIFKSNQKKKDKNTKDLSSQKTFIDGVEF